MNKETIKKIKYHEYKIAKHEASIEFHGKELKKITKVKQRKKK